MNGKLAVPVAVALLSGLVFGQTERGADVARSSSQSALDRIDPIVEPTDMGRVYGRVYDADTGVPITGAEVSAAADGKFATSGKSLAKTEKTGVYQVEARIGHRLARFYEDASSRGVSAATAWAMTHSYRLDVDRVALRVTAPGYKPFVGVVPASSLRPESFSLYLSPVLLVKEGGDGCSTAAPDWGAVRIVAVQVSPVVAGPGEKVTLRAWITETYSDPKKPVEVACVSELWKGAKKLKASGKESDGQTRYEVDFTLDRNAKNAVEPAAFYIASAPVDCKDDYPVPPAIVQVGADESARQVALTRKAILDTLRAKEYDKALNDYRPLLAGSQATRFDWMMCAYANERLGRYEDAVQARYREFELAAKDDKGRILAIWASDLASDGHLERVIDPAAAYLATIKEKDQPNQVPAGLIATLGRAHMKAGKLAEAEKLDKGLSRWDLNKDWDAVALFRSELRLARADARLKEASYSPSAKLEYGRALILCGKTDEGVQQLSGLLATGVAINGPSRDITLAMLRLPGKPLPVPLDSAIKDARAAAKLGEKAESRSFEDWDGLGMLLIAKAAEQLEQGDSGYRDTLGAAAEALRKAIFISREVLFAKLALLIENGGTGYMQGFGSADARLSFNLLQSIKVFAKDPSNSLGRLDLADSLVRSNQNRTAEKVIDGLPGPALAEGEGDYVHALHHLTLGDSVEGRRLLQIVVKANPRHSSAHQVLASLLDKENERQEAKAELEAYAKWYGAAVAVK